MSETLKDLQPGCIVLIAGFDDIPEHQFQVDEVYEDLVNRPNRTARWGIRRARD